LENLHPSLWGLPPPIDAASAHRLRRDFHNALRSDASGLRSAIETFNQRLAREWRVTQWEVMNLGGGATLRSVSKLLEIPGTINEQDAIALAIAGWQHVLEFRPPEIGTPRRRARSFPVDLAPLAQRLRESAESFRILVTKVGSTHSSAWDELLAASTTRLADGDRLLPVPDGELSFFGLLHALRHVGATVAQDLTRDLTAQGEVLFVGTELEGGAPRWQSGSILDLMAYLGLAIASDGAVALTPRWRSLVRWLAGAPQFRGKPTRGAAGAEPPNGLPTGLTKAVGAIALQDQHSRPPLDETHPTGLMTLVARWIEILKSEHCLDAPQAGWDLPLIRVCGAAFAPAEFLIRAYYPFEQRVGTMRDASLRRNSRRA
jgi:hypothetical protein